MKYINLSEKARADLQVLTQYAAENGQDVIRLRHACASETDFIEYHIKKFLLEGDWSEASTYQKRLVGMLIAYLDNVREHGGQALYGRDRQAKATSEANAKAERTSLISRISLPNDVVDAFNALSSEEKGDLLAEALRGGSERGWPTDY